MLLLIYAMPGLGGPSMPTMHWRRFRVVLDLVPGSAKIIHPVFITSVAVKIVRDDRMTRPGFRLSGNIDWLRQVQPQVRRRHGAAKFALIHGVRLP